VVSDSEFDRLLDTASRLVTEDGFDAVSIAGIAHAADVSRDDVLASFGSLEDLLVSMLNREYRRLWADLVDDIERDPRGGLLSQIYRYTLSGVYENPLVRALYLADRNGLNTIVRSTHGFAYVPDFRVRASFIETMQEAGMVRREVDADALAALLSAVAAGAALTAPSTSVDLVNQGLVDLLSRAVDTEAADTTPGKIAFVEFALSLAAPERRG